MERVLAPNAAVSTGCGAWVPEQIVLFVRGAAHHERSWTVKRPDGLMIGGAHTFRVGLL